jgi:hypothetical protein
VDSCIPSRNPFVHIDVETVEVSRHRIEEEVFRSKIVNFYWNLVKVSKLRSMTVSIDDFYVL